MYNITKISDITASDIADFLRLTEVTTDETAYLTMLLGVAKDYILKYTGIKDAEALDGYQDLVIVVFVLCQDMYDNRAMYVDTTNTNRVVESILNLHQVNLI